MINNLSSSVPFTTYTAQEQTGYLEALCLYSLALIGGRELFENCDETLGTNW